ncbi:MAG: stimulus-sensing domain-containing protein [Filomicrobium sp.]
MALDSDRDPSASERLMNLGGRVTGWLKSSRESLVAAMDPLYKKTGLHKVPVASTLQRVAKAISDLPPVRFISARLAWRIVVSNLLGFTILFLGILYLSLDSSWIINAKREAMKTQGQIIAAAIAGKAVVKNGDLEVDSDRLPVNKNAMIPFRDDGFAAIQLSIRPEKVARIFRRLTAPTNTRARIYDRKGDLVVDSIDLLKKRRFSTETISAADIEAPVERPKTKNIWTRLQHLLIGKEVQVYREIGNANGRFYPEVRDALKGTDAAMLLLNEKSEQIVSVAIPIRRYRKVMGVLLLSTPPGEIDDILDEARNRIWPLAIMAVLASLATGLYLARTVAGPMTRLSETAENVSRDINLYTKLPEYSEREDEVGQMARAFSAMTKSLYERIEASEKFAADVAHELKNPLTAASSMAQSLEYARTDEDREQVVQQIQNELKRLNRLISDVSRASMLNAQLQRETAEPLKLETVLDDVVSIFTEKISGTEKSLKLRFDGPRHGIFVGGNAGRLGQVFTNLIDNALSFSPDTGTVSITARIESKDVVVTIEDEGPGIQADKLEAIFSRFYTYRPTEHSSRGNNSGLGLSISQEIIEAHNGKIWAENLYEKGANQKTAKPTGSRFSIRLPLLDQNPGRSSRPRRT